MHSEYAVEPAAMGADWQTFRFLIEKFGLDKGRLISRLPKKWESKVIQAAKESGVSAIKLTSMVERLKNTSRLRMADFGREYQPDQTWIENAVRQHADRPFRAIICAGEDRPCGEALGTDDCSDDHALFFAPISKDIPRTADAIADALAFLAMTAREIDLIDPFFDLRAAGSDYVSPLASLLARLSVLQASCKVIRVHFRTHDSRPPEDIFLRDLPRQTDGIIPAGFSLQFIEWSEIQGGDRPHWLATFSLHLCAHVLPSMRCRGSALEKASFPSLGNGTSSAIASHQKAGPTETARVHQKASWASH